MKGIDVKLNRQKELVLIFGENVQLTHLISTTDRVREILKLNKITKINIKSSSGIKADYNSLQLILCLQKHSIKNNIELSLNSEINKNEFRAIQQLNLPINFNQKPLQIN